MSVQSLPLIAGNWKMNGLGEDVSGLAGALLDHVISAEKMPCTMVLCPPFTLIDRVSSTVQDSPIKVGGQDCHVESAGAFTGSISARMLADIGCDYVIVGHSERRRDFGEGDATVGAKADTALAAGLTPIICVGESLEQREAGQALDVVSAQVAGSLPGAAGDVVIAYEPVWAIGTGLTAAPEDVAEMHASIRARLDDVRPGDTPILYGGSANPDNAAALLATPNVGGLLVGGASLDPDAFWTVANAR